MIDGQTPVTVLWPTRKALCAKLAALKVSTVSDLWFLWPLRYEDHARLYPIAEAQRGQRALFEGHITQTRTGFGRRRSYECFLESGGQRLRVRFFRMAKPQWARLEAGGVMRAFGEIREDRQGLYLSHPKYQCFASEDALPPLDGHLHSVYPTVTGLSQSAIAQAIAQSLAHLPNDTFTLPDDPILRDLPSFADAIRGIHQPVLTDSVSALNERTHPAWQRLIIEELSAQITLLKEAKAALQAAYQREPLTPNHKAAEDVEKALPFRLTDCQQRVLADIESDLKRPIPMQRLLQGDVGAGKTLVAALTIALIAGQGQIAVMAPTEILAEQLHRALSQALGPIGLEVGFLLGRHNRRTRAPILAALADGSLSCVVGTHALFQEGVTFQNLTLMIVDEQHRFGVEQRLALLQKANQSVHQLLLSATPIPRTLAMTLYADLDVSIMREKPPGRQPVITRVLANHKRDALIGQAQALLEKGQQIYWVCPLIEESDALSASDVDATTETLQKALPTWRVAAVHGKLPGPEKEGILQSFRQGDIHVLVATTVVEVGVDVPNASLMVIENAERFGLSQLHQLRGRVGRAELPGYCVLLYQPPLGETAQRRLETIRASTDGFALAEADLAARGPGEWLGTRQTGQAVFKAADLVRDQAKLVGILRLIGQLQTDSPEVLTQWIERWQAKAKALATV